MKYICTVCNWTGSAEELYHDYNAWPLCPLCYCDVDVDDREPDPLTEQPSEVRSEL